MKCRNCGLSKSAHIEAVGAGGWQIWQCPNGSGDTYPATTDVKLELHYRAGEDAPWVAKWLHPLAGGGEVASETPLEALELAARKIDKTLEVKSAEEKAIEKAIKE